MDQADIPTPPRSPRVNIPSEEEARQISAQLRGNTTRRAPTGQALSDIINRLPRISEQKLTELGEQDSSCPICLNTFLAVIAEEEMTNAMDSAIYSIDDLGVTKLDQPWQCGHMFCRRDITKWMQEGRRACPMCRRPLAEPIPGEPEEAGEAPISLGTPIDISPEIIIAARHLMNADFETLMSDINDPNPPSLEELRRRFLENNPGIPAQMFDGLTGGELRISSLADQQNEALQYYPPLVPEDVDEPPPSGMYS